MSNSIQIIIQNIGTKMVVGLQGQNKQDIVYQYYSFYNWGATDGYLHWMSDSFAYFWINNDKLFKKWLYNSSEAMILNQNPQLDEKTNKELIKNLTHSLIEERKNSFKYESFFSKNGSVIEAYSLGEIDFFKPEANIA